MNFGGLDQLATDRIKQPSTPEFIRFLFWEKGIGYIEFDKTPLPYIFKILNTLQYVNKEKEKVYKNAKRK